MSKPVLLTMSGSLRKGSYNRMLVAQAAAAFGEAEVIEGDLNLPLYDGDVEDAGVPEAVTRLCDQMARADAVVISGPEYNKGYSGVLKNALDWLSRPSPSVLKDKPVAVMSAAAGRTGGETAQFQVMGILMQLQMQVVHGPLILVAAAQDEFGADGSLPNAFLQKQIKARMERLRALV